MDQRASPLAPLAWPALGCLGLLICAAAAAQEQEGDPLAGSEAGDAEAAAEETDPCASEYLEGRSWIDWLNLRLHRTACETALWFDHLFGDYRLDEKLEATYGRAFVGVAWDEHYGFEDDLSFRARLHFPNMERRLNAFIGRDDREDVLEDAQRRGATSLPRMFDPEDDEWLVGLGYRPISSGNSDLDFDLGMNFNFPIEPWARARYRHRFFLSETDLVRFRHTLFWERDDGWGLATRIDYEHAFPAGSMLRWRGAGKVSDITRGADWFAELSYYHRVGRRRALAHQIGANGETGAPVLVENYFVRFIYRQQILREWLFLEIGPGLAWRREEPGVPRDSVPILRFGVEMLFGDYRGQGTAAPVGAQVF
ncbi:MAG: hypothetical protein OXH70_12580 [Acidobacteria bacterium]|nr:hypothetical protein [Acidobacteriota bacterium]